MSFIVRTIFNFNINYTGLSKLNNLSIYQIRQYAARKGTREKARKKKVKLEVKKVGFIPHNQRDLEKLLLTRPKKKIDDSWKQLPTDNVYPAKYYRWKVYSFTEAVQCHRETHHPTMYNEPQALLNVILELNMEGEKKNRFIDNFTRITSIPHVFDHGQERNVLVFSKDQRLLEEARNAGVALAGDVELIKDIQSGHISLQDFQYVIAHPNILPELVSLRGLMKRKFPNPKNGTLGTDIGTLVKKFLHGIHYSAKKDEYEQDYGIVETTIGPLSMETSHLEENFAALLQDVHSMKPKRRGIFVTRCLLACPPATERLKVDHNLYLERDEDEDEEIEVVMAG